METHFQDLLSTLLTSTSPTRAEIDVALDLAYSYYLRFHLAWRGQHIQQKDRITPRVRSIHEEIDDGPDFGSEEAYRYLIHKYATERAGK